MEWVFNDGGRTRAGRRGLTGDCVCRAVSIATGKPYTEVYETLAQKSSTERKSKTGRSASKGIKVKRKWFHDLMKAWNCAWTPTMGIGTGCHTHLANNELPMGRLIVRLSHHCTAVINGVIHDTYDPQRKTLYFGPDGKCIRAAERCVYGYWTVKQ